MTEELLMNLGSCSLFFSKKVFIDSCLFPKIIETVISGLHLTTAM